MMTGRGVGRASNGGGGMPQMVTPLPLTVSEKGKMRKLSWYVQEFFKLRKLHELREPLPWFKHNKGDRFWTGHFAPDPAGP